MIDRVREIANDLEPQARTMVDHALTTARERFVEGSGRVREYVIKNPAQAVAIALGVGVLIGWLIKRR